MTSLLIRIEHHDKNRAKVHIDNLAREDATDTEIEFANNLETYLFNLLSEIGNGVVLNTISQRPGLKVGGDAG